MVGELALRDGARYVRLGVRRLYYDRVRLVLHGRRVEPDAKPHRRRAGQCDRHQSCDGVDLDAHVHEVLGVARGARHSAAAAAAARHR